jgi:hypothetical protein
MKLLQEQGSGGGGGGLGDGSGGGAGVGGGGAGVGGGGGLDLPPPRGPLEGSSASWVALQDGVDEWLVQQERVGLSVHQITMPAISSVRPPPISRSSFL